MSPAPARGRSTIADTVALSNEPREVQKLQAELELAEAELRAARLRNEFIQAKEQAEEEEKYGGSSTLGALHNIN
jgi:hypothetical protein